MNRQWSKWWYRPRRRRRLSRQRRWAGAFLLVVVALTVTGYVRLTDEARLRGYAEKWLARFTGGEVRIDRVRLDLLRGLHLIGVQVDIPAGADSGGGEDAFGSRRIFRCSTAYFRVRLLSLLSGDLVVPEIIAERPELTLVSRSEDGVGNWQLMFRNRHRPVEDREAQRYRPMIRLRDVNVRQYMLKDGRRTGRSDRIVKIEARPSGDTPEGYHIALFGFAVDSLREPGGTEGTVSIDLDTLHVSGHLPTMAFGQFAYVTPPVVVRWIDLLNLSGVVHPDRIEYEPGREPTVVIRIESARFAVPVNDEDAGFPAEERFLQFTDVSGEARFDGRQLAASLTGQVRGCDFKFRGTFTVPPQPGWGPQDIGYELEAEAEGFPLPRTTDDRSQAEARFVRSIPLLEKLERFYDWQGWVDLGVTLRKETGRNRPIELVEGKMVARDCAIRYFKFPYLMEHIAGEMRIEPGLRLEFHDLSGTHGTTRGTMNGWVDGLEVRKADLHIDGRNISIDDDLLAAMKPRDRRRVEAFHLTGDVNAAVRMTRTPPASGEGKGPWKTAIDVDVLDGSARFEGFPYPLEKLRGAIRLADDAIEVKRITGRQGEAEVRITGESTYGRKSEQFELAVAATNIGIDDTLLDALPPDSRARLQTLKPAGRLDAQGRLFSNEQGSEPFGYDLAVELNDASFVMPKLMHRLDDVSGRLAVQPHLLTIRQLKGRLGTSEFGIVGELVRQEQGDRGSLALRCESLDFADLDGELLPKTWRDALAMFQPKGAARIGLTARWKDGLPAGATQPAGPGDFRLEVEPLGCAATFSGFPLPVEDVRGMIRVVPGRVELQDVTACHERGHVELKGDVTWEAATTSTELSLEATDMPFDEALRQAVPWRVRRWWNDARPTGRFDLDLPALIVSTGEDQTLRIMLDGMLTVREAGATIGLTFDDVAASLEGSAVFGRHQRIDATVSADHARWKGRDLEDVIIHLRRPEDDDRLAMEIESGRFCGGDILGKGEITYPPDGARYGWDINVQGVSLKAFLNANRESDEPPVNLSGRIRGRLSMEGRLGSVEHRRGEGVLTIAKAQILKMPWILTVLQLVHLTTDGNAFHNGSVSFMLDGQEILLREIDLRGRSLSLVGRGRILTPTGMIDLRLLLGSPLALPRVEVLTDLLEGVSRELFEVRIRGTLRDPDIRAEPVRSLRDTIDAILSLPRETGR